MTIPLPDDLYIAPSGDALAEFKSIQGSTKEAAARRMDLAFVLHLEELKAGRQGWLARLTEKLDLGEDSRGKTVISDDISIFRTFRLPPPLGLGVAREEIKTLARRQLRTLAQNRAWTTENGELALQMLRDPKVNEETIRERIKKDKPETNKTDAESYETVSLRLTSQDAAFVRDVMQALQARRAYLAEEPYEGKEAVVAGKVVAEIMAEWQYMTMDLGGAHHTNIEFMPGGALAGGDHDQAAD